MKSFISKEYLKQYLRTFSMVIALLMIWVLFYFATDGAFLQARNLSNLFRQLTVTGILATGMMYVIVAGHIDLSVGSVVCFIGVCLAMLIQTPMDPTLALLLVSVGAVLLGILNGFLVSVGKIPAFIVSLGGMMIFRGLSMGITSGVTIPLEDNWIAKIGSTYLSHEMGWVVAAVLFGGIHFLGLKDRRSRKHHALPVEGVIWFLVKTLMQAGAIFGFVFLMNAYEGIPVPVLIMLALMILFHFVSRNMVFGRHVYAVGGSPEAAKLSGISIHKTVIGVFVLMSLMSVVASLILTSRVGSASPDAGQLLELDAIAACVIGGTSLMGGRGSIPGALLGALVMESLSNGMSMANLDSFWQYIVKGTVLVVAVGFDVGTQRSKS